MRLVLDTNTVVSGLLWDGPPSQIMTMAMVGKVSLFTSVVLLDEVLDVLQRPKLAQRLKKVDSSPKEICALYQQLVMVVAVPALPTPVCDDPDDDAVLACAVVAGAQAIVSGDNDLLRLEHYAAIPILQAVDFLTIYNAFNASSVINDDH